MYKEGKYIDVLMWRLINPNKLLRRRWRPPSNGSLEVTIRKKTMTDNIDEIYKQEEVSKQVVTPWNADSWMPELRKSLKKRYDFTILADGEIVGSIGFGDPTECRSSYEVGFAMGYEYWGQGVRSEALKQLAKFAFEKLKIHKLFGDNSSDNPASGRVFEKAGFKTEAVFKEHYFKIRDGEYVDRIWWGLINPADK